MASLPDIRLRAAKVGVALMTAFFDVVAALVEPVVLNIVRFLGFPPMIEAAVVRGENDERVFRGACPVERGEDGADDGLFAEPLTGDCCRFDVRGGLLERLEEPGVSAAERSRIVEQLAMLNDHARKHAD